MAFDSFGSGGGKAWQTPAPAEKPESAAAAGHSLAPTMRVGGGPWSLGTAVGVDGAWKVGIYFFKVDIGSRSARLSASRNGAARRPGSRTQWSFPGVLS